MNYPKNQKGITLIMLIVTMIILIIIASVSISSFMDEDGGLWRKAKEAENTWENTDQKEQIAYNTLYNEAKDNYDGNYIYDPIMPTADITYEPAGPTPTNQDVIATLTANKRIRTPDGWGGVEGTNNTTYTKKYVDNKTETIGLEDIAGNPGTASLSITHIDKLAPTATMAYAPAGPTPTNQNVVATLTANEPIKTPAGWTSVGGSSTTYRKTYTENKTETVGLEDIAGNIGSVVSSITYIDKIPSIIIEVAYSPAGPTPTNQDVRVTLTANEPLQVPTGWTLVAGTNNTSYTRLYEQNKTETLDIKDIAGNITPTNISINYIDKIKPIGTVALSPSTPTKGNVTVTLTTDEPVRDIAGWAKTNDTTYTKLYTNNGSEVVTIQDIAGNTNTVNVSVTNIDRIPPTATVAYSPAGPTPTNQNVTATLTANEPIATPSGWTSVGGSNTTYRKTYTDNTPSPVTVTITDIAGNDNTVTVSVTHIDKIPPTGSIEYAPAGPALTNQPVVATLTANEPIRAMSGWTVVPSSSNQKYTRTYTANTTGNITITDTAGNTTTVPLSITHIDTTPPTANVTYSPNTNTEGNVTATMYASEAIQTPTGWTLIDGATKRTFTKIYTENKVETVPIQDIAGNNGNAYVSIKNIISILASVVKVGDYVQYMDNPNSASYYASSQYTGASDKSIMRDSSLKWQVLEVVGDKVILISDKTPSDNINLYGATGYNNAVKVLNEACDTLYKDSTFAEKARSINIEDLKKGASVYGSNESSVVVSRSTYPAILQYEKNVNINGVNTGGTLGVSEQDRWYTEGEIACTNYSVIATSSYSVSFSNTIYRDLIYGFGSVHFPYYLASRGAYKDSISFSTGYGAAPGVLWIGSSTLSTDMLTSAPGIDSRGIRPIVELKVNLKVLPSGNGNDGTSPTNPWVLLTP